MEIRSAAVIGAGVMGSGIAAHLANAGISVTLLDVVPGAAAAALQKLLKADPAPLMHPDFASLITPAELNTGLAGLSACDWIIEAIIENRETKAELFRQIDAVRKAGSVVSSNTSTIPLSQLVAGQSDRFVCDFMITHLFNPPRYMRLLELVGGPQTRPEALETIAEFADRRLGKGVVRCKDRPGFIANRIGSFWLQAALNAAFELGISVEEADAVCGKPMGFPKTGVFGLMDLVGLDLVPHIVGSLLAALPPDDPFRALAVERPLLTRLIRDGYTGRKGKGGFYRLDKSGGKRVKLALDLVTGDYRPALKPRLDSVKAARGGLRTLLEHRDRGGAYARAVLIPTLAYAASLVPEIADDIEAVDRAMRLGYNWKWGPFELIDQLGADWLAGHLLAAGTPAPPLLERASGRSFYRTAAGGLEQLAPEGEYRPVARPEGVLLLSDVKRATKALKRNGSAALWDIGNGVLCLEFTSKMNALDSGTFAMVREAMALIGDGQGAWKALVVHNEGENFSVGANLGAAMFLFNIALWRQIETLVAEGQTTYLELRQAPFPVVAAPSGLALGGGCEFLLHCDAVQAHTESYIGLVEAGVGLLPAWGGTTELLLRHAEEAKRPRGPLPPIAKAFETIALAKVAKSAFEARDLKFLRPQDGITMNRDRLLADAKARALALAAGYHPPPPRDPLHLPGESGRVLLRLLVNGFCLQGKATPHDTVVSDAISTVLTGGATDLTETVSEEALLALERQEFMRLVRTPATLARIETMLTTGKPLRN